MSSHVKFPSLSSFIIIHPFSICVEYMKIKVKVVYFSFSFFELLTLAYSGVPIIYRLGHEQEL